MRTLAVLALSLLAACGDPTPASEPAAGSGMNQGKPFMPPAITTGGMQGATQARESMRYVAEAGQFQVALRIDGRPRTFRFGVDMVALRVADVPTLEYPVGFVKLDPLSLQGGADEQQDRAIVDLMLRTLGSPIQIFVEVHSVTDLRGRLVEPGSDASGALLGMLQIDDRQLELTVHTIFERTASDKLTVEIPPFDVSLADANLAERLPKLARLLGAKKVDPVVSVSGSLALTAFTGDQLPTFVRTPVTVSRVSEIRERLDAEIEDHDAAREQALRQGVPEELANTVSKSWYDKGKAWTKTGREAPPVPKKD